MDGGSIWVASDVRTSYYMSNIQSLGNGTDITIVVGARGVAYPNGVFVKFSNWDNTLGYDINYKIEWQMKSGYATKYTT